MGLAATRHAESVLTSRFAMGYAVLFVTDQLCTTRTRVLAVCRRKGCGRIGTRMRQPRLQSVRLDVCGNCKVRPRPCRSPCATVEFSGTAMQDSEALFFHLDRTQVEPASLYKMQARRAPEPCPRLPPELGCTRGDCTRAPGEATQEECLPLNEQKMQGREEVSCGCCCLLQGFDRRPS